MKTNKKVTIGLISLACLTSAALIGTAAGSLAWYAYSRVALVSFRGTSIANTALLNVGIVDDGPNYCISNDSINQYGLQRESYDGHSIVFTHSSNGFDYHVIREFLTNAGYATDELSPLTTQERALNSTNALSLFKSPEYGQTVLNQSAIKKDYVYLPLAFRVGDSGNSGAINTEVWLTGASVTVEQENINQAVRVFVDNGTTKFLMKPEDRSTTTGSTKVGGMLDLDGDGTYDYNEKDNNKEYYYGQYTGTPALASSEYGVDYSDAPFINANGVEDTSEGSTFYAKHFKGSRIITNINEITPKVAEYQTFGTVMPSVDTDTGDYVVGDTGIAITNTSSASGIGYANLTIFVEGWDHSVIDKAAGYNFDLDLKFEINKVN